MSDQERKEMFILADMLQGEINRICVTTDLSELDTMILHAKKNIEKLQTIKYKHLKSLRNPGDEISEQEIKYCKMDDAIMFEKKMNQREK